MRPKIHYRSFTQSQLSTTEASQAAAHQAATFLRSRFHSVFDDSSWSSVPHYHSHVDEDDEKEEGEEEAYSDYRCLFEYRHWYEGLM